jgi:hypothetical protein
MHRSLVEADEEVTTVFPPATAFSRPEIFRSSVEELIQLRPIARLRAHGPEVALAAETD